MQKIITIKTNKQNVLYDYTENAEEIIRENNNKQKRISGISLDYGIWLQKLYFPSGFHISPCQQQIF